MSVRKTTIEILDRSHVNWDVVRRAYGLVVETLQCRNCSWMNSLVVNLLEVNGKIYGYHHLDISHHTSTPIDHPRYYLLVELGRKVHDIKIQPHTPILFYPKGLRYEMETNITASPTPPPNSPPLLDWVSDLEMLNELPKTTIKPFVKESVSTFGDCYLFSSKVDGRDYTVICDLYRVLVFDRPAADGEISYLPLLSQFIHQWDYDVVVGDQVYFIKVRDGIHIVCSRNKENPLPKVIPLWEKSTDKYIEVTLPITFYRRKVERMLKTIGGGTLEVISEGGQLTFNFYTPASTQAYPLWGDTKIKISEVTPRVGAQIPYAESLRWCEILGIKRKWYDSIFPTTKKFKVSIPYNWKTDESEEVRVLPVKVRVDDRQYPYLALYPTGLFYTTDD